MYKITIEELTPIEDKNYPRQETLYTQVFDNLDITKVAAFLNNVKE